MWSSLASSSLSSSSSPASASISTHETDGDFFERVIAAPPPPPPPPPSSSSSSLSRRRSSDSSVIAADSTAPTSSIGVSMSLSTSSATTVTGSSSSSVKHPAESFHKMSVQNDDSDDGGDWDIDDWDSGSEAVTQYEKPTPQVNQRNVGEEGVVEEVVEELTEFMNDFADARATEELNEDLRSKSCGTLLEYFIARPELAQYTLDSECPRMPFEVVAPGGVVERNQERVLHILSDIVESGPNDLATGSARPEHLLVRMANQSVLADMLTALHEYLLRPELLTSVVVREGDILFRIDLHARILSVDATFTVSTVQGQTRLESRSISSTSATMSRLELGKLSGKATVELRNSNGGNCTFEFGRPELNFVADEQLRATAEIIAAQRIELQEVAYSEKNAAGDGDTEALDRTRERLRSLKVNAEQAGSRAAVGMLRSFVGIMGRVVGAGDEDDEEPIDLAAGLRSSGHR